MKIMIDSVVLYAYKNPEDIRHKKAKKALEALIKKQAEIYVTRYILDEYYAAMLFKNKGNVMDATKELLEIEKELRYKIIDNNTKAMLSAVKNFKKLGMHDSINLELMKQNNIKKIISFDPKYDSLAERIKP